MIRRAAIFAVGYLIFATAHIYLAEGPIHAFSPTYDEPIHLAAGVAILKCDNYAVNGLHHPAFGEIWAALGTLHLKPAVPVGDSEWRAQHWLPSDQYRFADHFLFHNFCPADDLMTAARRMQLVLSLVLGLVIGVVALSLGGLIPALTAMGFWAFSNAMLAHGTTVSTDISFALFFFSFFVSFLKWPDWRAVVASGLSLGLCFASKYFAISIGPILAVMLLYSARSKFRFIDKAFIARFVTAYVLAVGIIAVVYQFQHFDIFWEGLTNLITRAQAGRRSFFLGQISSDGHLLYFPFLLLTKTELPLLLTLVTGVVMLISRKWKIPSALWIPPTVFLILACFSHVQIGHRYLLSLYPFIIVIGSASLPKAFGRMSPWIAAALVVWMAAIAFQQRPNFLSYFNELVGGSKNGYRYVTDSNVDWGQGLKEASAVLSTEQKQKGIYLTYFGVDDPHARGLKYLDIGSDSLPGHQDDSHLSLSPTTFVISATALQGTYFADPAVFAWVRDYRPQHVIENSMFIYDFSHEPKALDRLKALRPR